MLGTSRFPISCMKWQDAVILENDLRNQLDQNFSSRWTDGTPHSSSLVFHFTLWTNYFWVQLPLLPFRSHVSPILATGVQTVSTNASFGISVCGFRWRTPVLKRERVVNCTSLTRFSKKNWRYLDQISHRLLPWYFIILCKILDTD